MSGSSKGTIILRIYAAHFPIIQLFIYNKIERDHKQYKGCFKILYQNVYPVMAQENNHLHPVSGRSLKAPAMMEETRMPMVMKSWFKVTSIPRMLLGATSATYTGTVTEANPGEQTCYAFYT